MKIHIYYYYILFALALACEACGTKTADGEVAPREDREAMALLEGVWFSSEDEEIVFTIKGDTIYYDDSQVMPAKFSIVSDTLIIYGQIKTKYKINRLTPHGFEFTNQPGDVINLYKSEEQTVKRTEDVVQTLVKKDTVVVAGGQRYHAYVQVNPTSYKVLRSELNEEGLGIDKVFYDNIVNLTVYNGTRRVFSHDFKKQEFAEFVPDDLLEKSVLSDIAYVRSEGQSLVFEAFVGEPESYAYYIVEIKLDGESYSLARILHTSE